jgi:hypothetical protein
VSVFLMLFFPLLIIENNKNCLQLKFFTNPWTFGQFADIENENLFTCLILRLLRLNLQTFWVRASKRRWQQQNLLEWQIFWESLRKPGTFERTTTVWPFFSRKITKTRKIYWELWLGIWNIVERRLELGILAEDWKMSFKLRLSARWQLAWIGFELALK